jgi:hypothetical protein
MNFQSFYQEFESETKDCYYQYKSLSTNYMILFEDEVIDKQEHISIYDIKSTEEAGSSNNENSYSVIAEDNAPALEDSFDSQIHSDIYNSLLSEVKFEIYNGGINELINESLGIKSGCELANDRLIKQKHKRTLVESECLEEALKANNQWDKAFMKELGAKLGLSYRQVYKWYWDRSRKDNKHFSYKNMKQYKSNKFEDVETVFDLDKN